MADPRNDELVAFFRRSQQAVEKASADAKFMASVLAAAERMAASLKAGGKVLLAGNGGSAADAQHIAAELVGRFIDDRAPLAAVALTTDTSALTAIGNDYGFEQVFARQVSALARSGDVFVGISTSGKSPNILAALKAARERKLVTIGFTRDGQTPMSALCDVTVGVPAAETALIQQIHITAAHAICHLVERALFGAKG
ncbi:MAG TPA: D-sedoheptulose 7-phosphate isomerase [Xanthobacteraceae bacterium]